MKKNTKLALVLLGVGGLAYYVYTKMRPNTKANYAGTVGDRLGFADGGYVVKSQSYNNNLRYSMTGAPTFFTNESEKLNY